MPAARRQRERPARSDAVQAPLRVERIEEREEVVLVGPAPVEEDERAVRLARGRAGSRLEAQRAAQLSRGFGDRRQHRLDLLAQVLEVRREREALPEGLERLVGREAGADRRDLEQHAARLAEVDRLEVEAVDHGRRPRAAFDHALAPGLVLLGRRGPGDVVDGARARGFPPAPSCRTRSARRAARRAPRSRPRRSS